MGNRVRLFDGAEGAARHAKELLEARDMLCPQGQQGRITFENSDESHIALSKKLFEDYEV